MCCRFPLEKPVCMLFWKLGLLWGWCLMFHFIVALSAHWSGKRPLEGSAPSHPAQSRVNVSLDQAFPIQVLKIKKSSRMEFLQPSRDTCSITSLPESSVISPGLRHFACIFHEPFEPLFVLMSLLALLCIFQLLLCAITLLVLLSTLM